MISLVCAAAVAGLSAFQPAAEFAPQKAVWMSWPTYDHMESLPVRNVTAAIIRELVKTVDVELLVENDAAAREARRAVPSRRLNLRKMNYAEIWTRDFGPSFLTDGKGGKKIADFGFDFWGYEPTTSEVSRVHEQVDRLLAGQMGISTVRAGLVGEGGNREANGRGTVMVTGAVELRRNPGLTREQIEERLKKALGVQSVIWIPEGMVDDGYSFDGPIEGDVYLPITTGGHVDNIARFVDSHTILLAEVTAAEAAKSKVAAENRRRLEVARKLISEFRDHEGKAFKIVRMPSPDLAYDIMKPGDVVYEFLAMLTYPPGITFPKGKPVKVARASSYLNFLITNGLVLTSKFYVAGAPAALKRKDAESLRILRRLFPGRRVVALDTRAVNLGGGGVHCITSHEPR